MKSLNVPAPGMIRQFPIDEREQKDETFYEGVKSMHTHIKSMNAIKVL